jgi:hypothetical protein
VQNVFTKPRVILVKTAISVKEFTLKKKRAKKISISLAVKKTILKLKTVLSWT